MAEEELRFDGKLCIIIFRYLFRNNDAAQVDVYVFSCFLFSPHFLRTGMKVESIVEMSIQVIESVFLCQQS